MKILESLWNLPKPLKKVLRPAGKYLVGKYPAELAYWRNKLRKEGGVFKNTHYEKIMMAMAQETDQRFIEGKVVADFGCGPRGSLTWATNAALRIGIDVLSDRFADEFTENILSHGMIYLKSTEKVIPLPPDSVDVMFSLNALDHVDCFPAICKEILRVLKPGGELIASFNLEEPVSATEPQKLDEQRIEEDLLQFLEVRSYRLTKRGHGSDPYQPFFEEDLSYAKGEIGFLWVRAMKKG